MRTMPALLVALIVSACGAVEVPTPRSYRLAIAGTEPVGQASVHVLRVQDLRLAAHISPDNLMVADGPNLLQVHPLDLWAGPLDRMITDVVVCALRRSRAFVDVKGSVEPGGEDLSLSATVTDFHYVRRGSAAEAVVGFDVQVRLGCDHTLMLARELSARVPVADTSAPAAVAALGQAVLRVVEQLVAACATLPVRLDAGAQTSAPGLAAPPTSR